MPAPSKKDRQQQIKSGHEPQEGLDTKTEWLIDWLTDWPTDRQL
jgi:hypothetical protein